MRVYNKKSINLRGSEGDMRRIQEGIGKQESNVGIFYFKTFN